MGNVLPYIAAMVALFAAVLAIVGKDKWDASKRGLRRLTPTGWLAGILAMAAFFTTVSLTCVTQRAAEEHRIHRERVRGIARAELNDAICVMLRPLYMAAKKTRGAGFSDCDLIRAGLNMLDPDVIARIEAVDLNSPSPFGRLQGDRLRWGKAIQDEADRGHLEIEHVQQKYSSFLESNLLDRLHKLQDHATLHVLRTIDDEHVTTARGPTPYVPPLTIDPLTPALITTETGIQEMAIPRYVLDRERPAPEKRDERPFLLSNVKIEGYADFWRLIEALSMDLNARAAQ